MKILKKALSIAIILSCFISMFAYAAPTEKVYNSNEQNIYVAGKTDISNQTVTLLMKNQDNSIAYIDEGIAVNGNYSFKFKFKGNCQNCTLYIMDGSKNITETVLETRITGLYPLGNIDDTKISEDKKTISISANIKNLYNDAGNAKLIIAWYDQTGNLISCDNKDFSYDYISDAETFSFDIPSGNLNARVFIWQDLINCVPLSKPAKVLESKNVLLIGDSLGAEYDSNNCTKGWGQYIGNYMNAGANIINRCHAGWSTLNFLINDDAESSSFSTQGWNYAKKFITSGDYVIFGLGYNDYSQKGYNGKYCEYENGIRKMYYSNANNSMGNHPEWAYERRTDENGEYITIDGQTVYTVDSNNSTGMSADSNNGYLTFFYKDSDGTLQSYAADAFYDNMKIMLDECAQMNVNVIIRDIACISNVKYAQSRDNKRYYAYVTQSIINEKIRKLASEYDNVISVDLFNTTKNHFTDIYNSFSNSVDQLPDYYYNADGSLKECYTTVTDWRYQQLIDTYWLTLKNFDNYYSGGKIVKNNDGKWAYKTADGTFVYEDTLHYASAGADYIASEIANLIKSSNSPLAKYIE